MNFARSLISCRTSWRRYDSCAFLPRQAEKSSTPPYHHRIISSTKQRNNHFSQQLSSGQWSRYTRGTRIAIAEPHFLHFPDLVPTCGKSISLLDVDSLHPACGIPNADNATFLLRTEHLTIELGSPRSTLNGLMPPTTGKPSIRHLI
jgi:hypothetical protein